MCIGCCESVIALKAVGTWFLPVHIMLTEFIMHVTDDRVVSVLPAANFGCAIIQERGHDSVCACMHVCALLPQQYNHPSMICFD